MRLLNFAFMISAQFILTQCNKEETQSSRLNWIKSRVESNSYAFLTQSDLNDDFLFGVNVIKVNGFYSNALNMSIPPKQVKLINEQGRYLKVMSENKSLLKFALNNKDGYLEIDFASSVEDLTFQKSMEKVGGVLTSRSQAAFWVSEQKPKVTHVSQDEDTVVVDIKYYVSLAKLNTSLMRYTKEPKKGDVTLRLWLKRDNKPNPFSEVKTVAQGNRHGLGFFSTSLYATNKNLPIQRFALKEDQDLIFYLKDFPTEFISVAKTAVESWNKSFSRNLIKAKPAPNWMDVGDPRYNVIKWFDNTDDKLGWAGVAKMMVHPKTGEVISGNVYIQGSTLMDKYQKIVGFSQKANIATLTASLGGFDFEITRGENPVAPFFTPKSMPFKEYIKGYYLETIAHEIGHVLGLRHNFAASQNKDSVSSVMDYLPRASRHNFSGPGSYDIAAIQWAYNDLAPSSKKSFLHR